MSSDLTAAAGGDDWTVARDRRGVSTNDSPTVAPLRMTHIPTVGYLPDLMLSRDMPIAGNLSVPCSRPVITRLVLDLSVVK